MELSVLAALLGFMLVWPTWAAGLYGKNSAVIQVDGKDFNKKIKLNDKASIVEFYAPWCGHCKNLQPAYEKAAKALSGLANVAAVNCDDEENKGFCGTMGIKGFPTLKTVRQTGMYGKPIIMDYNGGRTASELVDAVKALIPNVVQKVEDKELESFLQDNNETAKAILFTEKGTTAALTKVLANEYVINSKFAQIRKKETKANEMFGVKNYPTLVLLPGGNEYPVFYDGAMEKGPMNEFLDKYVARYDRKAAAKAEKAEKSAKKGQKYSDSASSEFAKASAAHASEDANAPAGSAPTITLDTPDFTESPDPKVDAANPVSVPPVAPPIPTLESQNELARFCLGPKTTPCVLALLPPTSDEPSSESNKQSQEALASLANLAQKHKQRGGNLFPFYAISAEFPGLGALQSALELRDGGVQLIAVNGKRGWWMKYATEKGFDEVSVESWIDGIRFGEGTKERLPEGLITEEPVGVPVVEDAKTIIHEDL